MSYSPMALANTIIRRSLYDHNYINPLELQNIMYLAAVFYTDYCGQRLIKNDFTLADPNGYPYEYSVWNKLRNVSNQPIHFYCRDASGCANFIDEKDNVVANRCIDKAWSIFCLDPRYYVNLLIMEHADKGKLISQPKLSYTKE